MFIHIVKYALSLISMDKNNSEILQMSIFDKKSKIDISKIQT